MTKTQIVTNLKNSNCDKTQSVTKLENTKIVTKLKNLYCGITQKIKS